MIYQYVPYRIAPGRILFEKVVWESLVCHNKQVRAIFDR